MLATSVYFQQTIYDMQFSTVRGSSDWLTRPEKDNTHFFSLAGLCCDTASARADPWSTRLAWSAPPASASYEARPRSLKGMDFWVLVRLMMCWKRTVR